YFFFFFQAEDGIRDFHVTGVQTCALPISKNAAQLKLSLSQMAGSRLICEPMIFCIRLRLNIHRPPTRIVANSQYSTVGFHLMNRSEERRVGKECRSRGSQ